MDFGSRLKQTRLRRGKTLAEVAERLGKTEATVQRYESGNIKNLKADTIEELAQVYNVSPAYLMGWLDDQTNIIAEDRSDYSYIPRTISAGNPETVESTEQLGGISIPDSIMGKYAGQTDIKMMRINGESMNRVIPDKSLIAVKRTALCNIKDGDIVVYNDNYEYAVKRMYRSDEKVIFRPDSHNPAFTDYVTVADEHLDIVGKVVIYIVELD